MPVTLLAPACRRGLYRPAASYRRHPGWTRPGQRQGAASRWL